jgi:hypothetical protein
MESMIQCISALYTVEIAILIDDYPLRKYP